MAITYPLVNGFRYDFAQAEHNFGPGGVITGVKSVKYEHSLNPGIVRGANPGKLGRTLGEYDASGTVEIYKEEYQALIAALGDGYMGVSFDITVTYGMDGSNMTTDILHGCRIKKDSDGGSQGTDPLLVSVDLDIMWIEKAGLKAVPNQLV